MVKASGWRRPRGQLSSDLRGCRIMSTSSSSSVPSWNTFMILGKILTCARYDLICSGLTTVASVVADLPANSFAMPPKGLKVSASEFSSPSRCCSRMCVSSRNLITNDLIDVGVDTTTARLALAISSLSSSSCDAISLRSKMKVYTGFWIRELKRSRMTPRLISNSAPGTTWTVQDEGWPRMSARSGAMTVVLPAPMISWWHSEESSVCAFTNRFTNATWESRRMRLQVNSKSRKRGSYSYSPLSMLVV
mmetsp:Transcript_34280/g.80862  ORF Transcript_34280/g.80862 Transcript_34280/m.80862 type:complete len:249 (-) Transcript_34280:678-1424(-)